MLTFVVTSLFGCDLCKEGSDVLQGKVQSSITIVKIKAISATMYKDGAGVIIGEVSHTWGIVNFTSSHC